MSKGKGAKPTVASNAKSRSASQRPQAHPAPQKAGVRQVRRPSTMLITVVALVVVVAVGAAVLLNALQSPSSSGPVTGLITDSNTKGPATAKVTITEYSDFQ